MIGSVKVESPPTSKSCIGAAQFQPCGISKPRRTKVRFGFTATSQSAWPWEPRQAPGSNADS